MKINKEIICFDASLKKNIVGVGIYDMKRGHKEYHSFSTNKECTTTAETIALVCAMEYMYKNNIHNPNLFTDNLAVANNGIPDYLIQKFGDARLFWLPREFNTEADKLSKDAREVSTVPIKDLNTSVINDTKARPYGSRTNVIKDGVILDLGTFIRSLPLNKRISLLRRMALNDYQMSIVDFYIGKRSEPLPKALPKNKDDHNFFMFFNSIRRKTDIIPTHRKFVIKKLNLKNQLATLSTKKIETFIRSRELI